MADVDRVADLMAAHGWAVETARYVLHGARGLGVSEDVAATMYARGMLVSAMMYRFESDYVRLEPTLPGLDGWPHTRLRHIDYRTAALHWPTDPVGPFFMRRSAVALLLDHADLGSPARAALTAALWEAQELPE